MPSKPVQAGLEPRHSVPAGDRRMVPSDAGPAYSGWLGRSKERVTTALPLGADHRRIGVRQQVVGALSVTRIQRNADAGLHTELQRAARQGCRHGIEQLAGQPDQLLWLRPAADLPLLSVIILMISELIARAARSRSIQRLN